MNQLKISGKVLNAYTDDYGHFVCTISVLHNHVVDGNDIGSESIFSACLPDRDRSAEVDVVKGDMVVIDGYIRQDRRLSATGKERRSTALYINEIRLDN